MKQQPSFCKTPAQFLPAIGLSTNVKNLIAGGRRPILLGLACWTAVAVVSLAVQYLSKAM